MFGTNCLLFVLCNCPVIVTHCIASRTEVHDSTDVHDSTEVHDSTDVRPKKPSTRLNINSDQLAVYYLLVFQCSVHHFCHVRS